MKYLLLGYGISNKSIERYFKKNNICYDIYDDKTNKQKINVLEYAEIIKSNGIKNDHYIIKEAIAKNVKIISDLELFYRYSKCKEIIVITGTNGKSTIVSLLGHVLDCPVIGNIGIPLFDYIDYLDTVVIEASSYMCEYLYDFKADIYGIINIFENHLDHHLSFKEYYESKINLLRNISNQDYLIYNNQIINIENYINNFSTKKINLNSALLINNRLYIEDEEVVNLNELSFYTSIDNLKMVSLICYIKNIDPYIINEKIKSFKGVKYRLSLIKKYKDTLIYNDSKATNLYALNNAFSYFKNKKVLLICGGFDSYFDLDILNINPEFVITNGNSGERLYQYFKNKNIKVIYKNKLKEALEYATQYIKNNNIDILLFSPGFQSYDQFESFEKRGDFFDSYILNNL